LGCPCFLPEDCKDELSDFLVAMLAATAQGRNGEPDFFELVAWYDQQLAFDLKTRDREAKRLAGLLFCSGQRAWRFHLEVGLKAKNSLQVETGCILSAWE
jgi:hypothetical protein